MSIEKKIGYQNLNKIINEVQENVFDFDYEPNEILKILLENKEIKSSQYKPLKKRLVENKSTTGNDFFRQMYSKLLTKNQ